MNSRWKLLVGAAIFFLPFVLHAQDADGDNLPDTHELLYSCLLVNTPDGGVDYDGDVLTSLQEYLYSPLLNPCVADSDGDGMHDGPEVNVGSNPLDVRVVPEVKKVGSDLQVTDAVKTRNYPSLLWTGSEFGLAWEDLRDDASGISGEIYFARMTAAGSTVVSSPRITAAPLDSNTVKLAWTGSRYGLAWCDNRDTTFEIYFSRLDSAGAKLDADLRVTSDFAYNTSSAPSLVWTSSEFGLVWADDREGDMELYFLRIAEAGDTVSPPLRITLNDSENPSLVWTGSEYGVAWEHYQVSGNFEIYFARLEATGVKIGADQRITSNAGFSLSPSLRWTGSEFGLSWDDNRDGNYEIYFTRISAAGVEIADDVRLTEAANDSLDPSLLWTGTEFAVSWDDRRDGNRELYFARISPAGAKVRIDQRITTQTDSSYAASLAWSGSEFGVAFQDNRPALSIYQIYMARIGFDSDGDGLLPADETAAAANPNDWDTDDDGMADGWEVTYAGCGLSPLINNAAGDADGDGLTNLNEYTRSMNPCANDSDGDAMTDAWEVTYSVCGINPIVNDAALNADSDGLTNLYEFQNSLNPCNVDTDGDAVSDGLEVNTYLTNPLSVDTDSDNVLDTIECGHLCLNPNAADTDADTYGDGVEDTDHDGIWDYDETNPCPGEWYKRGMDLRVTSTANDSRSPCLFWTGSEYGVSWSAIGYNEIYFARVSALGSKIGSDLNVSANAGSSGIPSLFWTGSEYGVSWQETRDGNPEIYFARIAAGGFKIGTELRVTSDANDSYFPSLTYTGTEYGVSWIDTREGNWEIYFARVSSAGALVGSNVRVTFAAGYSSSPSLAWTGSEYGLAWPDERNGNYEIYFARLSADGIKLGTDIRVTPGIALLGQKCPLSWSGSEYAVSWSVAAGPSMEIFFARLAVTGAMIGSNLRITNATDDSSYPSLAWTSSEFGITWQDLRDGNYEIYFARVSAAGAKIGSDLRVTYAGNDSQGPSLAWTGSEYGVSWFDKRDGYHEIYFAMISNADDQDMDMVPDNAEKYVSSCMNTHSQDTDGDGIKDGVEDADHDGVVDATETSPCLADTDSDGMDDKWEVDYLTDPLSDDSLFDPDGDGFNNLFEHDFHLDPHHFDLAPNSSCSAVTHTNQSPLPISFVSQNPESDTMLWANFNYGVDFVATGVHSGGTAGTLNYTFSWGQGTYRFYTIATIGTLSELPPSFQDITIIYDTQKPESFAYAPDIGALTGFPITFSANDTESSTLLYYRKDGGSWQDSGLPAAPGTGGVFTFVPPESGSYDFYTRASDLAGNTEDAPTFPDHDATTLIDATPPAAPVVSDEGDYTSFNDRLYASWTCAGDPESGIDRYEYAIGTSAGGTDVAPWFNNGLGLSMVVMGLSLDENQAYYVTVRAYSGAGAYAEAGSDGIVVDSKTPLIVSSSPAHREMVNDDLPPISLPVSLRLSDAGGSGIGWPSLAMVLDFSTVEGYTQSGSTVSFLATGLVLGNHVVNVQVNDGAGNRLNQNVIFVVEDPRKVIVNQVAVDWSPGDPAVTFTADGGTGEFTWTATGGALSGDTGAQLAYTPNAASPGAYVVAASDAMLVSAEATVVIHGAVKVAPAVARLNPGDTAVFTAAGGSGTFAWTVTGGSCALSGTLHETCLFTAGGSQGQFSVKATAGAASFTAAVIVVGSVGRAIIVVGGGLVDSNRQVDALNYLGHQAYETLLSRGFAKAQIKYLNPDATQHYDGDGDGYYDEIAGAPTPTTLQNAIEVWSRTDLGLNNPGVGPGVPLIIYLVDHGAADSFLINYASSGAPQTVTPPQVDAWLDTVQGGSQTNPNDVPVVLIYDACFAGSFLDNLGAGNVDRVVVTSAGNNNSAYFSVNGSVSFSQFFWQLVRRGESVGSAFAQTKTALASWSGQTPWLDDNHTGAYETSGNKDGTVAAGVYLGADFVTGEAAPSLVTCSDQVLDPETSTLIWAEIEQPTNDKIVEVFALITPPGYTPPPSTGNFDTPGLNHENGDPISRVHLKYNEAAGRWEHEFKPKEIEKIFTVNGRYTATVYAKHKASLVSAAAEFKLIIFGPDEYEYDDVSSQAKVITVSAPNPQAHNFHDLNDSDWVKFEVNDGGTYKIFTANLASRCDTVLELYGPKTGSPPGPFITSDDDGGGGGSSMIYAHLDDGWYYVRARQYNGSVFGEDTEYDLRVDKEELNFGSLEGYVTDSATGGGIYGALLKVDFGDGSYVSASSIAGGYYIFSNDLPAGSGYTLLVTRANYSNYSGSCPAITAGARSRADVLMPAKTGTGILTGKILDGATPLGGINLVISTYPLASSPDGSYWIRLAMGANHYIRATGPGYAEYYQGGITVNEGEVTTRDVAMAKADGDGDGLLDAEETPRCTSPADPDTDDDGLCDGNTSVWSGPTRLCARGEDLDKDGIVDADETDPCLADMDGDGLNDGLEVLTYFTDPRLADSDGDGVSDGAEALTYTTNPLTWDSDHDALPDAYEIAHLGSSPPLDPNGAADGAASFDTDGNANVHEYWNGSDPWTNQPTGGAGCYYWGDSGAGDGVVGPSDAVELQKAIIGIPANYSGLLPNTGETQELNMDGAIGPSDFIIIQKMILAISMPSLGSRPIAIDVIESPGAPVLSGNTCHVTVAVRNEAGLYTPGLGVIFEIVSGPGSATLLGGEGSPAPAKRYDLSNSIAAGRSRIVLRIESPGAITLQASIPATGAMPLGRSSAEIVLNPAAVITGQ